MLHGSHLFNLDQGSVAIIFRPFAGPSLFWRGSLMRTFFQLPQWEVVTF
jgi:hypothetical protein